MKSSSYWSRKAEDMRECGRWFAADECADKAAKARRIEMKRKEKRKES